MATLKQHAMSGSVATLGEIPAWTGQAFDRPDIRTLKDTRAFFQDPELDEALDALEQHHFGNGNARGANWNKGTELAAALERLGRNRRARRDEGTALPPFRKVPG